MKNSMAGSAANYIDGFAFPMAKDQLATYKQLSEAVAQVWKKHGAMDYCEFVGDDMSLAGVLPFDQVVDVKANEVVIFGWVTFQDKAARDQANLTVPEDPEMAKLMSEYDTGFDPSRMVYAGFKKL